MDITCTSGWMGLSNPLVFPTYHANGINAFGFTTATAHESRNVFDNNYFISNFNYKFGKSVA
jgi:hypothetical protein